VCAREAIDFRQVQRPKAGLFRVSILLAVNLGECLHSYVGQGREWCGARLISQGGALELKRQCQHFRDLRQSL
jgi:hypothetical protein